MDTAPKFRSECGTPVSDDTALFCRECCSPASTLPTPKKPGPHRINPRPRVQEIKQEHGQLKKLQSRHLFPQIRSP